MNAPNSTRDFLAINSLLSGEELLVRDTVRNWVESTVLPGIEDWYERGVFPRELFPRLGELGLLGMHLSGYGTAGASAVSYGLACLELEAGNSGFRSAVSVQGSPGPLTMLGAMLTDAMHAASLVGLGAVSHARRRVAVCDAIVATVFTVTDATAARRSCTRISPRTSATGR